MASEYDLVQKILERHFGKRGAKVIVCLVLMVFGVTHTQIQEKFGVALSTTRRYRKALQNGNIEPLFRVAERERPRSQLDDFEVEILAEFNEHPPRTLREAQTKIETLTGIKRSLPRISVWLLKRGSIPWLLAFFPQKQILRSNADF